MDKPLDGYRVIDLTHVLAGPYCTYQLGLLGADVIKVESPAGDMTRVWGGTSTQIAARLGTGFGPQNAGKRSVVIDIKNSEGAALVSHLAASADIFVENYRPGTMARHGLDYPALCSVNPELIYLSISAFGQDGPHGHRPGFDDVVQATSGFMSINQRGDGPIRTGGPVLDYATGMHATSAVLAAALLRNSSGKGHHIDIAMQDVTMLLMNRHSSIAASTGNALPPAGNREGPMLGRFATADGFVMLAGYLPHHCRSICAAIGLTEFSTQSGSELNTHSKELDDAVERTLLTRTTAEWDDVFNEAAVVGGGVRDLLQVIETGQPAARGICSTVTSDVGDFTATTAGYKINEEVFAPAAGLPSLGAHTWEVLMEIGCSEEEIERLRVDGIIHTASR